MSKLLRLICMTAVLMFLTGCSHEDEPKSQPVEETWLMTYDDYHSYLDSDSKYKNLSREVTFVWEGDELSIKGIFEEYPNASIKGNIKRNKGNIVSINSTQAMDTGTDEPVYFHWGCIANSSGEGHSHRITEIAFFPMTGKPAFSISDDGNSMTLYKDPYNPINEKIVSFWYTKDPDEIIRYNWGYIRDNEFSTTWEEYGTGFPDVDIKVNMSFRKISDKRSDK